MHLYERQASSERSRRAALASTLRQRDQQLTHTLHDAAADSRHHAAADRQQARATERALEECRAEARAMRRRAADADAERLAVRHEAVAGGRVAVSG